MSLIGNTNEQKIWNYCKSKGLNDYGTAGLMGNLFAESGLKPNNLQDTGNRKLGMSDDQYANAVDNGSYTKDQFINDQQGWGLAQWTYWSRKKSLYEFARSKGVSIGSLEMQLDFLFKELSENFISVLNILKRASSVRQASDEVLLKFESPYMGNTESQKEQMKATRSGFGNRYYSQFATIAGGVSNMGYIIIKKGQSKQLSAHFDSIEFDCHGSGCCSETKVNEKLLQYLEKIREHFGKPITITSAYRCPVHNSNVGGATGSRHSKGDAADIVVSGVAPKLVAQYAESIGIMGIGLYETSKDGFFVHIDTREVKSFWYGQAQACRYTFGGTPPENTDNNSITQNGNSTNKVLSLGSNGSAVKALQENLIKLGYSCGRMGADGAYGAGTVAAVKKFQTEHNLTSDGIVGKATQSEIEKALGKTVEPENVVVVTASVLNVRSGAGTSNPVIGVVRKGDKCTLTEEKNGWGKLKSNSGWISLDYVKKA